MQTACAESALATAFYSWAVRELSRQGGTFTEVCHLRTRFPTPSTWWRWRGLDRQASLAHPTPIQLSRHAQGERKILPHTRDPWLAKMI
jgi:hypothetical protein